MPLPYELAKDANLIPKNKAMPDDFEKAEQCAALVRKLNKEKRFRKERAELMKQITENRMDAALQHKLYNDEYKEHNMN